MYIEVLSVVSYENTLLLALPFCLLQLPNRELHIEWEVWNRIQQSQCLSWESKSWRPQYNYSGKGAKPKQCMRLKGGAHQKNSYKGLYSLRAACDLETFFLCLERSKVLNSVNCLQKFFVINSKFPLKYWNAVAVLTICAVRAAVRQAACAVLSCNGNS